LKLSKEFPKLYPIPISFTVSIAVFLGFIEKKVINKARAETIKNMKGKGTGFFCKIPIEKGNIFVLMTNNHLIDEEIIKKEKNIYVTLNDDKEKVNIILDGNRKIYSSEKYDTTIIEVKPEKDKIKYFLELDEDIFQGNLSKESIYILQYPKNLDEQRNKEESLFNFYFPKNKNYLNNSNNNFATFSCRSFFIKN